MFEKTAMLDFKSPCPWSFYLFSIKIFVLAYHATWSRRIGDGPLAVVVERGGGGGEESSPNYVESNLCSGQITVTLITSLICHNFEGVWEEEGVGKFIFRLHSSHPSQSVGAAAFKILKIKLDRRVNIGGKWQKQCNKTVNESLKHAMWEKQIGIFRIFD